jgi:DNA replication protein DnaC
MTKTETKSTVLLKHHLKSLKLPTMHNECEKIAQRCAADNADHLAYLLQLCELELIERERKAAERRLKAARFPAAKLLDEFDFAARPSINKPLVLQLVQGDYLEKRENVLLVGPSGTGKSHLATALGMAACAQGQRVRFFRVTELITQLLEAKEERQLLRYRQALTDQLAGEGYVDQKGQPQLHRTALSRIVAATQSSRVRFLCLTKARSLGGWRGGSISQQAAGDALRQDAPSEYR